MAKREEAKALETMDTPVSSFAPVGLPPSSRPSILVRDMKHPEQGWQTIEVAPGPVFEADPFPSVERPDDEAIAEALEGFKLEDESQRARLWQTVRNLVESGARRAARLKKEG